MVLTHLVFFFFDGASAGAAPPPVAAVRRPELLGHGREGPHPLPLPTDPELDTEGLVEEALATVAPVPEPEPALPATRPALPEFVDLSQEIAALKAQIEDARTLLAQAEEPRRKALELYLLGLEHRARQMEEEEQQYIQVLLDL